MSLAAMLYGAALSATAALVLAALLGKDRRPAVLVTVVLAAFLMPLCWNAILRTTGATAAFSHDLPFRPFPISWQDTGSGVFTLAGASLALAWGPRAGQPARRTARTTLLTAVAALLIDIYAY